MAHPGCVHETNVKSKFQNALAKFIQPAGSDAAFHVCKHMQLQIATATLLVLLGLLASINSASSLVLIFSIGQWLQETSCTTVPPAKVRSTLDVYVSDLGAVSAQRCCLMLALSDYLTDATVVCICASGMYSVHKGVLDGNLWIGKDSDCATAAQAQASAASMRIHMATRGACYSNAPHLKIARTIFAAHVALRPCRPVAFASLCQHAHIAIACCSCT
eukprot:9981-Heterococcus_DN1.PRE.1